MLFWNGQYIGLDLTGFQKTCQVWFQNLFVQPIKLTNPKLLTIANIGYDWAMLTLYGATGYTGRLIAAALKELDLPIGSIRLAGRSAGKLEALAKTLPYRPEWAAAEAGNPKSLKAMMKGSRVVISAVGPFTDLGEPLVALAAASGVHYLDTTNELGFVHRMWGYDELAKKTGAAICPAFGFEVALADCAAARLAGKFEGGLGRLDVIYALSGGGSSLGTRKSAVRSLGTSWLGYREGNWVRQVPCSHTRRVALPRGERLALAFPSSEITAAPRHIEVGEVGTWMAIRRRAGGWAPWVVPAFACMARGPAGRLIAGASAFVARPNHGDGIRREAPFLIQVEARQGNTSRQVRISGRGVYEVTAKAIAYAAGRMLAPDYTRAGVLAPAQAVEPGAFLQHAAQAWGLEVGGLGG